MKTETKHTPWKVKDNRIIQRFRDESWNNQVPASFEDIEIGRFNSCEQAELAALAVNAHEELVGLLKAALENWGPDDKTGGYLYEEIRQAITKSTEGSK